jgi:hypothetical protein
VVGGLFADFAEVGAEGDLVGGGADVDGGFWDLLSTDFTEMFRQI